MLFLASYILKKASALARECVEIRGKPIGGPPLISCDKLLKDLLVTVEVEDSMNIQIEESPPPLTLVSEMAMMRDRVDPYAGFDPFNNSSELQRIAALACMLLHFLAPSYSGREILDHIRSILPPPSRRSFTRLAILPTNLPEDG